MATLFKISEVSEVSGVGEVSEVGQRSRTRHGPVYIIYPLYYCHLYC